MSSNFSQTEKPVKLAWHVHIKTIAVVKDAIEAEAKREDRSLCYIVSRILEKYYEEEGELKVV